MVVKRRKLEKKVLRILTIILGLLILFLGIYFFFIPRFRIHDFEKTIEIPYASTFAAKAPTVCYGTIFNCENITGREEGNVDTSKLGSYTVTYTFSYKNKEMKEEQEVVVKDIEKPVIEITGEEPINYCGNKKSYGYTIVATDNYDGDITAKVETEVKQEKIIFKVEDSSGNKTVVEKQAQLKDDEKPVLTLQGDSNVFVPLNGIYEEAGITAMDNCDGDISSNVSIEGNVDSTKAGEYVLKYKVSDSNNNESVVERYVYVYQNSEYPSLDGKNVYLTFDDGPGKDTARLLDILKKYNVKATFFVTNQNINKGYDDVIKRMYDEGHTIALHSNTHVYAQIYTSMDAYFNDLYAIQDKVKSITGYAPMIIRFPGGSSNTISRNYDNGTRIMSKLTKAVQAKGFRYFDWNVDSNDAGTAKSAGAVSANVINALGNNNTYVVLQHDIKSYSVDAVETIIQFGLSHGYTFQALKLDSPRVEHRVNN